MTRHGCPAGSATTEDLPRSELGATFIPTQDEEAMAQLQLSILNMDPPRHNRMRRLVSKAFTPRMIARLEEEIERRRRRSSTRSSTGVAASSWRTSQRRCRCR
ncbi:MAG: hypothetical protein R2716_12890 [Microthrixaceae bacterium]